MEPVDIVDILFRSCARSNQKRYIDVPKSELLLGCLNSVLASAAYAKKQDPSLELTVHVLDDHSDPQTVAAILDLLEASGLPHEFVPMEETGQSASMRFANEYARDNCGELLYFVEDDYLHQETAVHELLLARRQFSANLGGRGVIISPCDHSVAYRAPALPTRVVLGAHRHWQLAVGTTSTYLISKKILKQYWPMYALHASYDPEEGDNVICEANTINLIYRQEFCFSPLPSLTAHVSHTDLQPLYAPWEQWWEKSRITTVPNPTP